MKHSTYTSYDDLPLMLSVAEVAAVLGISRAGAYELARSNSFPALKIGSRIVVPKDKFLAWIDANSGSKNRTAANLLKSQVLIQRKVSAGKEYSKAEAAKRNTRPPQIKYWRSQLILLPASCGRAL